MPINRNDISALSFVPSLCACISEELSVQHSCLSPSSRWLLLGAWWLLARSQSWGVGDVLRCSASASFLGRLSV